MTVSSPRPSQGGTPRRVAFVLHAHLPWALGHGVWPHGEEWVAEAAVHCYLPLIGALERLSRRGGRHLLTITVTPVLASQLADPRGRDRVDLFLDQRLKAARDSPEMPELSAWWHNWFEALRALWIRLDRDIPSAWRRLEKAGILELGTCAATHAYLPLAHTAGLVRLELATARDSHERLFGQSPRGAWMPECAYRPAGPWRHPVTGAAETQRPGVEAFLEEAGFAWTVVDAHLAGIASPTTIAAGWDAASAQIPAAPLRVTLTAPFRIAASDVAAFVREPRTAAQVWSREGGYPGDGRYLDFHKRHGVSGLRLWRVTDPRADLAAKGPYDPAAAERAADLHARHFVDLVAALEGPRDVVVVCPFDAELFGHWWHEGPLWLERVLERTLLAPGLATTTPARELASGPPAAARALPEGSWGKGGDHRVWVNDETAWMWPELRDAETQLEGALAVRRLSPDRLRAALNQLMLLAASDWPFLVSMGTAREYATERFRLHRRRLDELLAGGDSANPLPAWASEDAPFPGVEPAWWSGTRATTAAAGNERQ